MNEEQSEAKRPIPAAEQPPDQTDEAEQPGEWSDDDIERFRAMIGGKRDMVDAGAPAVIFVIANALWSLQTAALAAGAYGVAAMGFRLAKKQDAKRALLGLAGVAFAAGIALWTGEASTYFVPGVVTGVLIGVLTLISVVIKQPTSVVLAMSLQKEPKEFYRRPEVLRAHMVVTTVWGLMFLARAGLRAYLIANDEVALLGLSAVLLGYPVTFGLAGLSVLYLRRFAVPSGQPGVSPAEG